MRILVTGATGVIGRALSQKLVGEGHEIVVLSRRPESARVAPGAEVYGWEPEAGPPPPQVWNGLDAVIHLAGEPVSSLRWTSEQKRRIRESRLRGTKNLVDGMKLADSAPKVWVGASAVGYYGDRGDHNLDERSAPGRGFLSDICREWELESGRAQELGARTAFVRIGVVLSKTGGALEKILLPFRLGMGGRLGSGSQWFPWIHINDIVGIIKHALLTPSVIGPINGAAPGIVTNADFTKELASVLHRPVFFPVPEFALKIAMGEMAEIVLASQRVIPKVALDTGYVFQYPNLRPALEDLLNRDD